MEGLHIHMNLSSNNVFVKHCTKESSIYLLISSMWPDMRLSWMCQSEKAQGKYAPMLVLLIQYYTNKWTAQSGICIAFSIDAI